ncbi:MAG: 50S ribosomal protein L5 [Candidatus Taylorbacteria bacterium RIFCSPHIGHO2_02_FULL_45_28]|uniref:Large ribosomal subunit protein uL5 n=1 Tax=Candidatus Taylorbacteria bacterium RIFCSPHIGHO2_12_FULL_45_16 TaxID=1802315 RepID=A0A1G2MZ16_9BACT|nr:MAG: 50S ribosomal protein L5 [Candidatus Taylorbacteria bacterium RIFCSPHIGHO2_01_FULL_44_110]OHA25449.1 MAG: 50S ribosomal protein L5 [Candidatus Taylorbacteria bacterium RIFCSPHIGHO2_02_FULL_45_28]OHA29117.1 MAG: 50S ribosomal protein L5 [Candidatus Taylorbacteria bacterium RIFCSPHIGHO2_12_FULL_45_16]OHA33339.1 MAG: 50S ribosomal protein L5 [Candidatus Taylorbacteria bacterium RIFCSPLOWO2_01_FULL_45_59]OHA38748.1 MAG: 50S ribosomal protein L5 [Candidatus Taylorbacteria bacterium RIFCSPLOW
MKHTNTLELNKGSFKALKDKLGLKNPMQAPRLLKVVISNGFGSTKDKKKIELIADRLAKITGQKPAVRVTKKAIATFKTRQGDAIGYQVTLRGPRMFDFMDRLIHIALPRTKDFRGLSRTSVDDMGNFTIGIKEHTIFPETSDEDLKDVFGLAITIVTTSSDKKATLAFLEHIGMPLKRELASVESTASKDGR